MKIIHTSCYIPEDSYTQLRYLAIIQKKRVHDLLLDGLDNLLKAHGLPLTTRRPKGGRKTK